MPTGELRWQDLPVVERYAGAERADLRRDWLRAWPLPWYAHRFSLVSLAAPTLLPAGFRRDDAGRVDESGGLPVAEAPVTPEKRLETTQIMRQQYAPRLGGFLPGGPACAALRELLASCQRDGVPAALVVMPEGPEFRSWYPPETWPQIQAWLEQVGRDYDAPLINAREWCGEDDFMDSHHLIGPGADKFTERLGRECILPRLRGPQEAGR